MNRPAARVSGAAKLRRGPNVLRDFNGVSDLLACPPRRLNNALQPPLCGQQNFWIDVRLEPQRLNTGGGLDGGVLVLLKGANLTGDAAVYEGVRWKGRGTLRCPGVCRERLEQPRVSELQLVAGEALGGQLLGLSESLDGLGRAVNYRLNLPERPLRDAALLLERR